MVKKIVIEANIPGTKDFIKSGIINFLMLLVKFLFSFVVAGKTKLYSLLYFFFIMICSSDEEKD